MCVSAPQPARQLGAIRGQLPTAPQPQPACCALIALSPRSFAPPSNLCLSTLPVYSVCLLCRSTLSAVHSVYLLCRSTLSAVYSVYSARYVQVDHCFRKSSGATGSRGHCWRLEVSCWRGSSGSQHLPPTAHRSPLTTHHSPLTTHHSPPTTHHPLIRIEVHRYTMPSNREPTDTTQPASSVQGNTG